MQIPAISNGIAGVTGTSGISSTLGGVGSVSGSGSGSGGGFGSMLTDAISSLNDSQNTASSDSVALATGQASDVTSVVTDVEKANLEMQLAVQVRNKAVDGTKECRSVKRRCCDHLPGGIKREIANEDGQSPKNGAIEVGQQPETPVERRLQGLLTWRRVARSHRLRNRVLRASTCSPGCGRFSRLPD